MDALPDRELAVRCRAAGEAAGLHLVRPRLLRRGARSDVLRCDLGGGAGSAIVKSTREPDALFENEWCGLELLGGRADGAVPHLLGGDRALGLLVLEDLGDAPALEDPLFGGDRDVAEAALRETARALGGLHGAASLRCDEYRALRGAAEPRCISQADEFRRCGPGIRALLEAVDVAPAPGLDAELEALASAFANPGAWLTYTVGDMAPSNVLLAREGVRFVDLEYGGLRHAGYDAVFWRAICPVPGTLRRELDALHRDAFRAARGADPPEGDALAASHAHRLYWSLTWDVVGLLDRDRPVVPGGPGMRHVQVAQLRAFVDTLADGEWPALIDTAQRLAAELETRWPGSRAPLIPALDV